MCCNGQTGGTASCCKTAQAGMALCEHTCYYRGQEALLAAAAAARLQCLTHRVIGGEVDPVRRQVPQQSDAQAAVQACAHRHFKLKHALVVRIRARLIMVHCYCGKLLNAAQV